MIALTGLAVDFEDREVLEELLSDHLQTRAVRIEADRPHARRFRPTEGAVLARRVEPIADDDRAIGADAHGLAHRMRIAVRQEAEAEA